MVPRRVARGVLQAAVYLAHMGSTVGDVIDLAPPSWQHAWTQVFCVDFQTAGVYNRTLATWETSQFRSGPIFLGVQQEPLMVLIKGGGAFRYDPSLEVRILNTE